MTAKSDALCNETTISYEMYAFLPITVTQVIPGGVGSAAGLSTQATYDYRVFQPDLLTNVAKEFDFLSLLRANWVLTGVYL
jgi:hypothetical protein